MPSPESPDPPAPLIPLHVGPRSVTVCMKPPLHMQQTPFWRHWKNMIETDRAVLLCMEAAGCGEGIIFSPSLPRGRRIHNDVLE